MTTTLTILGCGSSGGVPRIGGDWGLCDPANPRNRRLRCSILLEKTEESGTTRVLIDTAPDLREQMLGAGVGEIDGVCFSHEHADHTHGIDELRGFYLRQRRRVPIWADEPTMAMLKRRFSYCFETAAGSDYPPVVMPTLIEPGREMTITGAGGTISTTPFLVNHGNVDALGFRFGKTAYTPDLNGIPDGERALSLGPGPVDCRCLEANPSSKPFLPGGYVAGHCALEAATGNPDQHAQRHGL